MKELFRCVTWVLLTVTILLASFSGVFLISAVTMKYDFKGYDIVPAQVIEVSDPIMVDTYLGPVYYQDVTVSYQVSDKAYTTTVDHTKLKAVDESFSVDDTVPIYVNKKKPSDISLFVVRVIECGFCGVLLLRLALTATLTTLVSFVLFKTWR